MKYLFNAVLRLLVKIALHLYFSKITVSGKENIPKGKAVLVVSNHQNALIDPLLIATQTDLKPHFLTRASVFKKSFISTLLDFIRMIPIYRVRDGINNMEKNNETFGKSVKILKEKGSIVIFAEGNHSSQRNLRSMKKGFARIAYQTLEAYPDLDLVVLPVGINYSNHRHSGSKVGIYFGKPIEPKKYFPLFDPLLSATFQAMEPLISTIPEAEYETKLDLLIQHSIDITRPKEVEAFFSQEKIKTPTRSVSNPYLFNKVMKVLHLPLYLIWLWMKPKVKDTVFYATFKFVIGLVGVPLWYIFLSSLAGYSTLGSWASSILLMGFLSLFINRNPQE